MDCTPSYPETRRRILPLTNLIFLLAVFFRFDDVALDLVSGGMETRRGAEVSSRLALFLPSPSADLSNETRGLLPPKGSGFKMLAGKLLLLLSVCCSAERRSSTETIGAVDGSFIHFLRACLRQRS